MENTKKEVNEGLEETVNSDLAIGVLLEFLGCLQKREDLLAGEVID